MMARRRIRKLAYLLVAGTAMVVTLNYVARRPSTTQWIALKINEILKRETGLTFELTGLELDILEGRLTLSNPRVGGDLFVAERASVTMDPWSGIFGRLRIKRLELVKPQFRIDKARLARIRLREREPQTEPFKWQLDELWIRDGSLEVDEPLWGLPALKSTFTVRGQGRGLRRLDLQLETHSLRMARQGWTHGQVRFQGGWDDGRLIVNTANLALGESNVMVSGLWALAGREAALHLHGQIRDDLAASLGFHNKALPKGRLKFKGEAVGALQRPRWRFAFQAEDVYWPDQDLAPLNLEGVIKGQGIQPDQMQAALEKLDVESEDLSINLLGHWKGQDGLELDVQRAIFKGRLPAKYFHAPFWEGVQTELSGRVSAGVNRKSRPLEVHLQAAFSKGATSVGRASIQGKGDAIQLSNLELDLPELGIKGSGELKLKGRSIQGIQARGQIRTQAERVSEVMHGFQIGLSGEKGALRAMPMVGDVAATVDMDWRPSKGIRLNATCTLERPGWEGALADRLQAVVKIEDDQLQLEDLTLLQGEGRVQGKLWLTWAKGQELAGLDQLDMCYSYQNLSLQEGLRAAALPPSLVDLEGRGTGWVRIHGAYGNLQMLGHAQAENVGVGQVDAQGTYGRYVRVPAFSTDFGMDINALRLSLRDIRVGESVAGLGTEEDFPAGLLSLKGRLDMDLKHLNWWGQLEGTVDSEVLTLPGPRFQARVEIEPNGSMGEAFGPHTMPAFNAAFKGGRIFMGSMSIEDLEGRASFGEGALSVQVGMAQQAKPLLTWEGVQGLDGLLSHADLRLDSETADTAHLAVALSQDLMQNLSVEAQFDGLWTQEAFDWKGRLNQLEVLLPGLGVALEQPGKLQGHNGTAELDLHLLGRSSDGEDLTNLRVMGSLPLDGRSLDLKLGGETELSRIKPVLDHLLDVDPYSLLGELQPSGSARFDLSVGGTFQEPLVNGQLNLLGGSLRALSFAQSVEDLDFTLLFRDREIILPKEEPAWGVLAQGDFKFWGKATWGLGGLTTYDLETRLEEFELRDLPEGFEMQGSLEARLKGDESKAAITGQVTANHMLYHAEISLLGLVLANAVGSVPSLGQDPDDFLGKIKLDLDLNLKEPWQVDTNLLKMQGVLDPGLPFKIKGNLLEPNLHGRINLVQGGRLTNLLPAGDVLVERGSITFNENSSLLNPVLDIQGRLQVPPYLVNLNINGSLDRLQIQPTSTPGLRRDEIIAILIDPSLAATMGTNATSSGSSAISTGMKKTTSDLLATLVFADVQERVRKSLNLDRVNVTWRPSAGSTEQVITVGMTLPVLGFRLPTIIQHRKSGEIETYSGQFEVRMGDLVFQLGASATDGTVNPSGEIRYGWTTR